MILLLLAVFLHPSTSVDHINKNPPDYKGLLDERTTYIPLGSNFAFECQAKKIAKHLTRADPEWTLTFFEDKQSFRVTLGTKENGTNNRFYVHSDGSLMAFGLQKIHDGVVLECSVDTFQGSTVSSRNIIAIQDCRKSKMKVGNEEKDDVVENEKRNPCLYGRCEIAKDGLELFEAVICKCSPQHTGLFCNVAVEGVVFYEILFYSPIICLVTTVFILALSRDWIDFAGKKKTMLFEQHMIPSNQIPDMRKLYPSAFLSPEEIQTFIKENGSDERKPEENERKTEENENVSRERCSKDDTMNDQDPDYKVQMISAKGAKTNTKPFRKNGCNATGVQDLQNSFDKGITLNLKKTEKPNVKPIPEDSEKSGKAVKMTETSEKSEKSLKMKTGKEKSKENIRQDQICA